MWRDAQGERRWPILLWALALAATPLVAIAVDLSLPAAASPWFELRDFFLLLLLPLILGVVSESGVFLAGAPEARDAAIVFAAIVLIAWFLMLLLGWGFDPFVTLMPFGVLTLTAGGFFCGRWAGRLPRRPLPENDDEA